MDPQQLSQQPTYSQPQPKRPPSTAKFALIIGICVVLLAGGFLGGYFLRGVEVSQLQNQVQEKQKKIDQLENGSSSSSSVLDSLNPLAGAQQRARDTERQTDVNSIATQLEVYYNDHGSYPSILQLSDNAWAEANLKGIDAYALFAPDKDVNSMQATATPDKDHYGYQTFHADNSLCGDQGCAKFTLYWYNEGDNRVVKKESLN